MKQWEEVVLVAKAIFTVLLKFIKSVADFVLTPINLLVVNLLPDLSNLISSFNAGVTQLIGPNLAFFAHLLPPNTRALILFYLGFLVAYYTTTIAAHAVFKVIKIIKAIKVW